MPFHEAGLLERKIQAHFKFIISIQHEVHNLMEVNFFINLKLKQDLTKWRAVNNSTRRKLDDLLKILIDCGLDLPKDSRTLKRIPRDINISAKCSGNSFI